MCLMYVMTQCITTNNKCLLQCAKASFHIVYQNLSYTPFVENSKEVTYKDSCFTMFIAALFKIARSWKELRCPSTEEWIHKTWYIYTMEYYSAIKNNEFMKILDKWMYLEDIFLSEVTQSQKKSLDMHSLISGY